MAIKKEDIPGAVEKIKEGTELFYQQRIKEALESYEEMLGQMLALVEFFFAVKEEKPEFQMDEERLQGVFGEILSAMEQKDYTLMADIINYDFLDYVEELQAAL